jgi:hypothetical protein
MNRTRIQGKPFFSRASGVPTRGGRGRVMDAPSPFSESRPAT